VGAGRARTLSEPRRIGMLLCRDLLSLSLREIGAAFGDRDVSTVLSAIEKARADVAANPETAARVLRLRELLPARGGADPSLRSG
jgi:chromosomal replication initiator protein